MAQPASAAFRPGEHLRRRVDFDAAYKGGAKVSGRLMTLFARANDQDHPRLGIAATRKIGNAVHRNRAKRLARELFRLQKPYSALDVVIVPRREFLDAPYPSLEREYTTLLQRAARSAHSSQTGRPPAVPDIGARRERSSPRDQGV